MSPQPLLLDDTATAQLLGMSRSHFQTQEVQGRIGPKPIYFGKSKRYARPEIIRWVEAGCPSRERWITITESRPEIQNKAS